MIWWIVGIVAFALASLLAMAVRFARKPIGWCSPCKRVLRQLDGYASTGEPPVMVCESCWMRADLEAVDKASSPSAS